MYQQRERGIMGPDDRIKTIEDKYNYDLIKNASTLVRLIKNIFVLPNSLVPETQKLEIIKAYVNNAFVLNDAIDQALDYIKEDLEKLTFLIKEEAKIYPNRPNEEIKENPGPEERGEIELKKLK